jgi:spore coat polysaccharide biosynthesis protein SpsF
MSANRRLVAALACRLKGSRLYGKPLQLLDVERGVSIIDHLVALLKTVPEIHEAIIGVAHGVENEILHEVARRLGVRSIRGDERDVLMRLIQCGEAGDATDVFRVTTESPYVMFEWIAGAWEAHVSHGNDVTVIDRVPEGAHFEIYTLEALKRSHERGDSRHRSELCSLYVREHRDEFQVEVIGPGAELERPDLRITVDNPEDLVLCRRVYEQHRAVAPRIPLRDIIAFLDAQPALRALVEPYVSTAPLY